MGTEKLPLEAKREEAAAKSPTYDMILAMRKAHNLTQRQAADMVYVSDRRWGDWERGTDNMSPGLWELFVRKTRELRRA